MMDEPQADEVARSFAEAGKRALQLTGVLVQGTCGTSQVPYSWNGDCSCVCNLVWAIHSSGTNASGGSHASVSWKALHHSQELTGAFSGSPLDVLS